MRIPSHDQRNLLRPSPTFELSLARQCLMHIVVRLPIQQTRYVVLICESLKVMELVLKDTLVQVAAETDVKRARETSHDVDAVIAAFARHSVILMSSRRDGCATSHKA